MPEPNAPTHFFARLKQHSAKNSAPDGRKDDFNYDANWMKHGNGADEVEIEELMVKLWLYRAITKYYAVYGIGTPEMAALFPWAGEAGVAVGNASPEEPPHAAYRHRRLCERSARRARRTRLQKGRASVISLPPRAEVYFAAASATTLPRSAGAVVQNRAQASIN